MRQEFITKCVRFFITKCDSYYKMRRLLQIATVHMPLISVHFDEFLLVSTSITLFHKPTRNKDFNKCINCLKLQSCVQVK